MGAVGHYDRALATFAGLAAPGPADGFLWCCALWGKGLALWNVAVGEGSFVEAPADAREAAWACLARVMGEEAREMARPLPFVLSWVNAAVTVASRSGHWDEVAAIARFLVELGSTPALDRQAATQVIELFNELVAATWHVILDVQPDAATAVRVARDLQARCEPSGSVLLAVRELLFAALVAAQDAAGARQVADEVTRWALEQRADDELLKTWEARGEQAQ